MAEGGTDGPPTAVTTSAAIPLGVDAPSWAGTTLGRYVVLEEVGRGGMGRVWRAYDPKLEREVALKELRRAALGSEGAARLVAEARAMAKLSHPNVVAVFDVDDLGQGGLMVVMEYVPGDNLRDWLKRARPWAEVVARFRAAGRGLAAAHRAGLLHRDFKPANVLVGRDGVVKVTDFGLAKMVGEPSADLHVSVEDAEDAITEAGVVMGTPRYMPPEQYRARTLTATADQYAFCVALWEALVGEAPFSPASVEQKDAGPPPWEGPTIPSPIVDAIRRGLAPQPEDRWPDMDTLLSELAFDPARRRRRVVAVGLGVLIGAVGVAGGGLASRTGTAPCSGAAEQLATVWDDARRHDVSAALLGAEVPYAAAVEPHVVAKLDAYARRWMTMHTEACEATTVRGEQSAAVMDLRMACLHRAKHDLEAAVEVLASADAEVVRNSHAVVQQLRPLTPCADLEGLQADVQPPAPADAPAVESARRRLARARAERRAGRYAAAKEEVGAARGELTGVDYGPIQTEVGIEEGIVLDKLGDDEAAARTLEDALVSAARWRQWRLVGRAATELVYVVGYRQQRPAEGLRYATMARGFATEPAQEATLRDSMTALFAAQGSYEEAVTEARAALALREEAGDPDPLEVATAHSNLGNVLGDVGQYDEAVTELRRALAIIEETVGPDHPEVAMVRDNLGTALYHAHQPEAAVAELRKAIAIAIEALGPDHLDVAMSYNNLGNVLQVTGEHEEAQQALRRALAGFEKVLDGGHPYIGQVQTNLARSLVESGDFDEALPLAEEAWARRKGDDVPPELRGDSAFTLARARWGTANDPETRREARALAERAAADFRTKSEIDPEPLAFIEDWLDDHPLE